MTRANPNGISDTYYKPYICTKALLPTARWLQRLADTCNISGVTPLSEFHCTIMYGVNEKRDFDLRKALRRNNQFKATISGFELFGDDKLHLVALLDCPLLVKRNKHFANMGIRSTYPTYRPHCTLISNPPKHNIFLTPEVAQDMLQEACDTLNKEVPKGEHLLVFDGEYIEELDAD